MRTRSDESFAKNSGKQAEAVQHALHQTAARIESGRW